MGCPTRSTRASTCMHTRTPIPIEANGGSSPQGSTRRTLRFLLNWERVKLEGFLGATSSDATLYGYYRGGLLFYAINDNVEFFAQIGFPRWDPAGSAFGVNLFYLLMSHGCTWACSISFPPSSAPR